MAFIGPDYLFVNLVVVAVTDQLLYDVYYIDDLYPDKILLNSIIMHLIYKIKQLALLILFISLITIQMGCKKFVQIPSPITQLVTSSVFNNNATATSALINIYQQMYNKAESYYLAQQTGLVGDELTNYSTGIFNIQLYANSMVASTTFGPWNDAYSYIYQANAILEGLQNNVAISSAIRNQLSGEAKFIRAFWNFYLTNCYGDIPLVISTNYSVNGAIARTPKMQVYQQIITDLKDAQNLLNGNFVDASDTTVTSERVRPTKWAATALLARAYLYSNDYVNAEVQSTSVINNAGTGMFSLVTDLTKVFKMNSSEAIWQLGIPLPNTINTYDGFYFILQGAPNSQAISPQLMSAFEANDNRKTSWIASYSTTTTPIKIFYYPYKYRVYNVQAISEYTMVLRLAEQYLIRAEARARGAGSGLSGAISDLNVIRVRAGLAIYAGASDQTSVINAILHERQVELFTEWGNRWFDMIRTGNVNAIMGAPGNVCQAKGGSWNSNWQLFPIPQTEINNDPNLTQNTGY
ncbi:MAG TPA: RagB/SusD family nutrient uptake outer membrane protein [Puia sp.]|jgi:hypothetical protein